MAQTKPSSSRASAAVTTLACWPLRASAIARAQPQLRLPTGNWQSPWSGLGVRCCHSLEIGQDRHLLKVLVAETRPVDARRCSAGALDADRVGWRRDHIERLIGWVAGHRVHDLQIMHRRGDGHWRVTELAQDGEFQVAVAFSLATAPPITRHRDGAADNGVEPWHVCEGHLL